MMDILITALYGVGGIAAMLVVGLILVSPFAFTDMWLEENTSWWHGFKSKAEWIMMAFWLVLMITFIGMWIRYPEKMSAPPDAPTAAARKKGE